MAVLLERTAAVRPGFALDAANLHHLVTICRRLEGLPLALEVAAARLTQFEPGELAVRLHNRHLLLDAQLAPAGRHRSLRAAIAWSHDLLGEPERRVFRRVAVFPAAWSLAAAEHVVADPDLDVVASVGSLLDKSLVRRVGGADGQEAFDLLDSLRRFGREKLAAAGEEAAVGRRFREYWALVATAAEAGMGTPDETFAVRWDADEVTNLRAALVAGIAAGDLAHALPVASVAGWHWYTHGSLEEGRLVTDLVGEVLARACPRMRRRTWAGPCWSPASSHWARGELDDAAALLGRALAMAQAGDVVRRSAIAHAFLGHLARTSGDLELAAAGARARPGVVPGPGNRLGDAWASHDLALVALGSGRIDEAAALLAEAPAGLRRRAGRLGGGVGRQRPGRGGAAPPRVGPGRAAPGGRAGRLRRQRRPAADRALRRRCSPSWPPPAGWTARPNASRPGCGARGRCPRWPGRWRRHAAAPESPLTPPAARGRDAWSREGATNRQIARALGIADKTVEVHLAQIMHRLGVQNRAQVAAHAAHSGPGRVPGLGDFPELSADSRPARRPEPGRTGRRRTR